MKRLRECMTRFGGLFNKQRKDRELDDEFESHLHMHIEDNVRSGMTPEEARRQAMIKFGGIESTKEACRDQRGLPVLETLWQDVRFGARMLRKNPGFTTITVLMLALGTGANTSVFSVVNAVLLRPLPYPESDRLVEVDGPLSIPNFTDWQAQQSVFAHLCLYRAVNFNVALNAGVAAQVTGVELSAGSFTALGLKPLIGRFYAAEEDRTGGPRVVVVSEPYWRSRFGSDPGALGKTLSIDGAAHTVIGVMPADFELVASTSLVVPLEPGIKESNRTNRRNQPGYQAFARLKPECSLERAQTEMEVISKRLAELYPEVNKDQRISLRPLIDARVGGVRRALWILLGAVLLVLFIACANVANLLMVRATARRKEMAVRSALGAGQGRILRQMLAESVLLATLGTVFGLVLARWCMAFIGALAHNNLPRADAIGFDARVLLFSTALALLIGVTFGLVPAWGVRRPDLPVMLKEAGRGSTASRTRLLHGLMVGQVALSLVLLFGAGLLLRSFYRLHQVKPGFDYDNVLTFRLDLPDARYATPSRIDQFSQEMLGRFRTVPGVQNVSLATQIPIGNRDWATDLHIEGRPEAVPSERPVMELNLVGPDYFQTLRIPVLKGRAFKEEDSRQNLPDPVIGNPDFTGLKSIIIDEEFVRRHFRNEDPIGKRIRLPWGERDQNPVMTVVGVVGRVKQKSLKEDNAKVFPIGYLPFRERPNRHIAVVVKTTVPAEALVGVAREQVAAIDAGLPIYQVQTLAQMRDANIAPERLDMTLLTTAALIAVTLADLGIYGVVAFWVVQRQREIGVRIALGAQRRDVLRLVLEHGMKLVLSGSILGLMGAFGFGRLLANLLFQVNPTDLPTLAVVTAILIGAAALACMLPACRASKFDPVVTLRHE